MRAAGRWISAQIGPLAVVILVGGLCLYITATFAGYLFAGVAIAAVSLIGVLVTLFVTRQVLIQTRNSLASLRDSPDAVERWLTSRDLLLGLPAAEQATTLSDMTRFPPDPYHRILENTRIDVHLRVEQVLALATADWTFSELLERPRSQDLQFRLIDLLIRLPASEQIDFLATAGREREVSRDRIEAIFEISFDDRNRVEQALRLILPTEPRG